MLAGGSERWEQRLPSGLSALVYRDYRLIWIGQIISNVGSSMQQLGLGWLIVELAQADNRPDLVPFYLGLVGLARGVPTLFAGLTAGVVADRVDRRKLLMGVQIYWAIISAVLAWLVLIDKINIGLVLALTVLSSVAQAFDGATRATLYPRLVPPRAMVSAIGLNSMSFNVAQFIGPLIGGLLIGPIGVGGLVTLNALSFLALIWAIAISSPLAANLKSKSPASPLRSLHESFAFVVRQPIVGWAMLLSLVGNIFARSFQQLLPAFVAVVLVGDAQDLSFMMTAAGVGALTGAFATASLGGLRRRGLVYVASGIVMGGMLVVFGLQESLIPALILVFLVACCSQLFITMASTLFNTHAPDDLRGRIMGLSTVVVQGGISIGALVIGALGALIGVGAALSTGGAVVALTNAAVLWRVKPLRNDTSRDEDAADARAAQLARPVVAVRPVRMARQPLDPEQTPAGR
ncbi:MAG TPA: MFS transporter [Chloroflexota bacterium]|jgi:predicted MFS family arabinose efflux permease